MGLLSPLHFLTTQASPPAHEKQNDRKEPAKLARVETDMETRAYHGLDIVFGAGKKINGQTHAERIRSAAKDHDIESLTKMVEPGAQGTDSLRKLTTATGTIIGVQYSSVEKDVNVTIPQEAVDNSTRLDALMQRHDAGKLVDPEGKRQLMQAMAYRVYTSPIVHTADGRILTFSQLGNHTAWEGITREDLSNSNFAAKMESVLNDCEKTYKIAGSFPKNKPLKYSTQDKGLRKLWQEAKKGNFSPELERQAQKFGHRAASFFRAKPYEKSTLDEVFPFELFYLKKTSDRERLAKKIIENQVHATIEQSKGKYYHTPSPGRVTKIIKEKKNYQRLPYKDKDAYLEEFIKKTLAPEPDAPPAKQDTASSSTQTVEQFSLETLEKNLSQEDFEYYDDNPDLRKALGSWLSYQGRI